MALTKNKKTYFYNRGSIVIYFKKPRLIMERNGKVERLWDAKPKTTVASINKIVNNWIKDI